MSTSRKRLPRLVWAANPAVTAAIDRLVSAIEQASAWAWGPGFDVKHLEGGTVVQYQPPPSAVSAIVTEEITAKPDADTLGQGKATLRVRGVGAALANGSEVTVYSNFSVPVPVDTDIEVAPDNADYKLIAVDYCPTEPEPEPEV